MKIVGWNAYFEKEFRKLKIKDIAPGRIILEERNSFVLYTQTGEINATLAGRVFHKATNDFDLPVTGDWVAFNSKRNTIVKILPRLTLLFRKAPGNRKKIHDNGHRLQLLSANIDTVIIVTGLDGDFNLRRLERYLTLVNKSGAKSIIVLNKSDLCSDIEHRLRNVKKISGDIPVFTICALHKNDLMSLYPYLAFGRTSVLIGSSGVGKSTIINTLLGYDRQKVQAINAHQSKGRHTTSQRELIYLPQGGVIIDTPGLRELQIPGDIGDMTKFFPDIEQLARQCWFNDCNHHQEPQCAVKKAVLEGILDPERLKSYNKLKSELLINSH